MEKKNIPVSIIIVNYKTELLTRQCIESVSKHTENIDYEIIVVDNASGDGSVRMLERLEKKGAIKLIKSAKNLGFSGGNNLGIKKARGKYVLLLNSDTEIQNDVVNKMYSWMENHPKVGISASTLVGIDGMVQSPGGKFPTLPRVASWMSAYDTFGAPLVRVLLGGGFHLRVFTANKEFQLDWVTGTFFFVRRKVIEQLGGLDEDYFMYTEEVDFCYRAVKAGWQVWYVPLGRVLHYGKASSTSSYAILQEFNGVKIFYRKHYPKWQYLLLRLHLKCGSLLRMIGFAILGKGDKTRIYAKAFQEA